MGEIIPETACLVGLGDGDCRAEGSGKSKVESYCGSAGLAGIQNLSILHGFVDQGVRHGRGSVDEHADGKHLEYE